MALYTFYPCRPDGSSDTFVTYELDDDAEAHVRCLHILDEHPTANHVVGWCGERKAVTRRRMHPDLRVVLTKAPGEAEETG